MAPTDDSELGAGLRAVLFEPYEDRVAAEARSATVEVAPEPEPAPEPVRSGTRFGRRPGLWLGGGGALVLIAGGLIVIVCLGVAQGPGSVWISDTGSGGELPAAKVTEGPGVAALAPVTAADGLRRPVDHEPPPATRTAPAGPVQPQTAAKKPAPKAGSSKPAAGGPATKVAPITTGVQDAGDFLSGTTVTLRSPVNGKYVRAETGYTGSAEGMLRAVSARTSAGRFTLVWNDERAGWSLRSEASGLYVSAEVQDPGGDNGMLRVRAQDPSDWETFVLHRFSDGTYAFYLALSQRYVSIETGYGAERQGMLRARSEVASAGERFALS